MALLTCTLDGLDLNNGTSYILWVGASMGAKLKTFDEQRSYSGALTQTNVSEAYYVPVVLPIRCKGSSLSDLDSKVQAINTKIDACTAASPKNLVLGSVTYQIVASPRVTYAMDDGVAVAFWTILDVQLNRIP